LEWQIERVHFRSREIPREAPGRRPVVRADLENLAGADEAAELDEEREPAVRLVARRSPERRREYEFLAASEERPSAFVERPQRRAAVEPVVERGGAGGPRGRREEA